MQWYADFCHLKTQKHQICIRRFLLQTMKFRSLFQMNLPIFLVAFSKLILKNVMTLPKSELILGSDNKKRSKCMVCILSKRKCLGMKLCLIKYWLNSNMIEIMPLNASKLIDITKLPHAIILSIKETLNNLR